MVNDLDVLNKLSNRIHRDNVNAGWWNSYVSKSLSDSDKNREFLDLTLATKMLLIITELSEAVEGFRKDEMDDHLPDRKSVEVELADAMIRIFDIAGAMQLDLSGAIKDKMEYNAKRADHKPENRAKKNGKRF